MRQLLRDNFSRTNKDTHLLLIMRVHLMPIRGERRHQVAEIDIPKLYAARLQSEARRVGPEAGRGCAWATCEGGLGDAYGKAV